MVVDEKREEDRSSRASSMIKTRRLCRKTRRQPPLASSTSFNGPFNPSGLFQIPLKALLLYVKRHEVAIRKIEISRGTSEETKNQDETERGKERERKEGKKRERQRLVKTSDEFSAFLDHSILYHFYFPRTWHTADTFNREIFHDTFKRHRNMSYYHKMKHT